MQLPSRRILVLVGSHIAGGLAAAANLDRPLAENVSSVVFLGGFFSQSGLLGFWAASIRTSGSIRLVGASIGVGCLAILGMSVSGREGGITAMLGLTTFMLTFGIFAIVRRFGRKLERFETDQMRATAYGFQFTIRQLMGMTAAVAVLLALFRVLGSSQSDLVIVIRFSLLFVIIPPVSVWATLSNSRIAVRALVAQFVSPTLGCLPLLFSGVEQQKWFWPTITFLQGMICIGSLLVVRSCGYRLVRNSLPTAPDTLSG